VTLTADVEALAPEELVSRLGEEYGARLTLACSFQKEESVLLDILRTAAPEAHVFALDTGVLFEETYATWREFERFFDLEITAYQGPTLARQASLHGDALWARRPDVCCDLRKVGPLAVALGEADAWITGVRREQSPTRANAPKLGWDAKHGLWKASPLADWTEADVWRRITDRGLPYHPLHDRGYESIGCTHCTQPGSGREGRWAGTAKTECGLHT
jgi:phosphoadenosine phosphosulfate reductase